MGLCLSICVRHDDRDDYYYNEYDERAQLLDHDGHHANAQDYEDEELAAARRKEKLDQIVNDTIAEFVDISSFLDIKLSLPQQVDVTSKDNQKDKFNFGNGMTNHYKVEDDEVDQLYINLTALDVSVSMRENLKNCSSQIQSLLEGGLEKIGNVQGTGKVVGKI